jgi:tetratricopeptide (TPR) repeat protein
MRAAREHLDRCAVIAESVGQPELRWFVRYHASCLALLQGRFAEAERLAEDAAQIGSEGGQPDALMIYGAQLACIAAETAREEEVVELIEQSMADNPGLPTFASGLASVYNRIGREDEARQLLAEQRKAGFDRVPRDVTWLTTLGYYARAIAEAGDRESARGLYEVMLPVSGLVCVNAAVGAHSVDNCLGMLAVTMGDHERADEHFAAATELEQAAGLLPSLALTRLWWARSLLARGGAEHEPRARSLLEESARVCREHGMTRYLGWAETLLAERQAV